MNSKQPSQTFDLAKNLKKIALSAFVIVSFGIYAAYERMAKPGTATTDQGAAGVAGSASLRGPVKDGTYTGSEVDAYYGLVKVQTTIQGGRMTDVQFLEYPSDRRTSVRINSFAVPNLQQEAIQAQTANVDIISGATLTSEAFKVSLQAALTAAGN